MAKTSVNWGLVGYFFEIIGLTLWVGGLLVIIGVVIPAVFNSMGMEAAGRLLRRIFDGYGYMTVGILVVLCGLAGVRATVWSQVHAPWLRLTKMEGWFLGGLVVVTFLILGVLGPQAVALQEVAFEAVSQQEKELAYDEFFRVHMIVRGLHMLNLGLAASLLIMKLRMPVVQLVNREKGQADGRSSDKKIFGERV